MSLHQSLLLSVAAAVILAHVGILQVACEVRLVDSPTTAPNAGRVQVWYHNTSEWLDVCVNDWDFTDGQVVCKELGYPGTVLVKNGSEYGSGGSRNSTGGFACTGDETSWLNCPGNGLNMGPCGDNQTAGVVCAAPGYEGCRRMEIDTNSDILLDSKILNNTVEECIEYATTHRDNALALYAAMEGKLCLVLGLQNSQSIAHLPRVNDSMCNKPCLGNPNQRCGGNNLISVYNVNDGICNDPDFPNGELAVQPTPGFFYFGTVVNFSCTDPRFEQQGAPSVQCVMNGSEPARVMWSNSTPECTGGLQTTDVMTTTTSTEEPETAPPGVNGAVVAALVLSILNTVILFLLIVAICIRRGREGGSSLPVLIPRPENTLDKTSGEVSTPTARPPNPVPAARNKNHRGSVPVPLAAGEENDVYYSTEIGNQYAEVKK